MHEAYGVDLEDPGLLQRRTWRWFSVRVSALLAADTRLSRRLFPPEMPKVPGAGRWADG